MILISSFRTTKPSLPARTTLSLMLRMMIICNYSLKTKMMDLSNLSPFTRQNQNRNLNNKKIWKHLCWRKKLKDDKKKQFASRIFPLDVIIKINMTG